MTNDLFRALTDREVIDANNRIEIEAIRLRALEKKNNETLKAWQLICSGKLLK